ncbi:MAG: hypothetical protein EHM45_04060 [Desulfobacteraceae bacterium]|nr:MAG: hypothetical protein EHM45_04060 [Desulfobacteraceae bacterium]
MNKNFILFSFAIFLLAGCCSYYIVKVHDPQYAVLGKFLEKLDSIYRGLGFVRWSESPQLREIWSYEIQKDHSLESIWKSKYLSIVQHLDGNQLTIRLVAVSGMDEEAEVMAKYIEYLSKEFPELKVTIERETTIDLR